MKKYNSGEIYFIREIDYLTGKNTSFVKIGLVRYSDRRDSWGRLYEHQTGNPRKLQLDRKHVLSTQAVDLVEARLHREFAKCRISGEWFEFSSDSLLDEAISKAKKIVKEVDSFVPQLVEAGDLKWVKSNGIMLEAKDEHRDWAFRLELAKQQLEICKTLQSKMDNLLTTAHSEGVDVSKYSSLTVTQFSPKFQEAEFKESHPDLWQKYQSPEKSWFNRFTVKLTTSKDLDLGEDFTAAVSKNTKIVDSISSKTDLGSLIEPNLELTHLRGLAEWEKSLNQAKLQLAIGKYEGIEGVCTWPRRESTSTKFNSQKFSMENPELYRRFISTAHSAARIRVNKTKS
jgi:hypothetical protein